jgi:hypothetical protein
MGGASRHSFVNKSCTEVFLGYIISKSLPQCLLQCSNFIINLEWVDHGTRPKVRWTYVVLYKKNRENRERTKFFDQLTCVGKVMLFWVMHYRKV